MSAELTYLAWVALLTAFLWIPYVTNMIVVRGLRDAVGYPEDPKPLAPWAKRLKAAHYNAIENLAVFAPLVFVVEVADLASETTSLACALFFWARLVHAVAYTAAIPLVRTLAFLAGWVGVVMLGYAILG